MRLDIKHARLKILAVLFLAVLFCGWSIGAVRNILDKGKVKHMTETMKTVCVGRFLIDVPAEARVSFRGAFLAGWDISIYPDETDEQFKARLESREAELKAEKNERDGISLEKAISVEREGIRGKIFVFDRMWTHWFEYEKRVDSTLAATNAYVRTNGTSVDFTSKLGDDRLTELARFVRQIQPLKEGEVPSEPGFCFGRAMIKDPLLASQHERVTMFLSLKDHPDFLIAFDTMAGLKPDEPLLARDAKNRPEFASMIKSLRRGPRSIGGIPGEEMVDRFNEKNGTSAHSCEWESISKQDSVFQPELSLEFSTGNPLRTGAPPIDSSLTDDAVLALWDKMSSSIRVRPTKSVQPAIAKAAIPEIGTGVLAYEACPASGWWQCYDGKALGEVEHGDTQFFRHGVRMPQATLLVPPTLWQRIKRERPTFQHEAPTYWKLVRHDPPLPPPQPDPNLEDVTGHPPPTEPAAPAAADILGTGIPGNDSNVA
jgi:hypothetical protein